MIDKKEIEMNESIYRKESRDKYVETDKVKVSVSCCVFNHERYLRKCLESLVSQKTNFRYEVLVHDDASTDKSAEIIREFQEKYPDVIKPMYQISNQYSKGNPPGVINLRRASGEYIAICEGDDFWTSDDKLQKQVDFLEKHQDFSMCVHAAYYARENGSFFTNKYFQPYNYSHEVPIEEIIAGWKFATNSIMYRMSARKELVIPFRGDCPNGDYATTVYLALNGKVFYINEFMSAYRLESIGSLNFVWKENVSAFVESRTKYIAMQGRLDEYTNFKYSNIIKNNVDYARFAISIVTGDFNGAREYSFFWEKLEKGTKVKLWLHNYCPTLFLMLQKMVRKIKNAKNSI